MASYKRADQIGKIWIQEMKLSQFKKHSNCYE